MYYNGLMIMSWKALKKMLEDVCLECSGKAAVVFWFVTVVEATKFHGLPNVTAWIATS